MRKTGAFIVSHLEPSRSRSPIKLLLDVSRGAAWLLLGGQTGTWCWQPCLWIRSSLVCACTWTVASCSTSSSCRRLKAVIDRTGEPSLPHDPFIARPLLFPQLIFPTGQNIGETENTLFLPLLSDIWWTATYLPCSRGGDATWTGQNSRICPVDSCRLTLW